MTKRMSLIDELRFLDQRGLVGVGERCGIERGRLHRFATGATQRPSRAVVDRIVAEFAGSAASDGAAITRQWLVERWREARGDY